MEHSFNKLESEGKNNIGNLTEWFTEANILTTINEDTVRQYFIETGDDPMNITWTGLNKVLLRIAHEQGQNYNYLVKYLGFDLLKKAIMTAVGNSMNTRNERRSLESQRTH